MLPTVINNIIFNYLDTNDKLKMMEYDRSIISYKNLYTLINNFFNIDKQLNILQQQNIHTQSIHICNEIINIFCNTYPDEDIINIFCNTAKDIEDITNKIKNNRNKYKQFVIKNNYKYYPEIIYDIDNAYDEYTSVQSIFNSINVGFINIQKITNNVKDKLNILQKILDVNDNMKKNDITMYFNHSDSINNILNYIKKNINYVNDINLINVYENIHILINENIGSTKNNIFSKTKNIIENYKNIYLLSEIHTDFNLNILNGLSDINTVLPSDNPFNRSNSNKYSFFYKYIQ
jgi:ribosome-binding factor A